MEKTVYLLLAMMIGLTANAQTIDTQGQYRHHHD